MPRTPQRAGWWRFPAPSVLVFLLLIGALPWVQIGCELKPEEVKQLKSSAASIPGGSKPNIPDDGNVVMIQQNGYQSIWAGYSLGSVLSDMEKEAKKNGAKTSTEKSKDEPGAAPMIAIYFLFVVGAVAVGFAMPPGRIRSIVFLSTAGLALLLLGIQTAVGFPLKNKVDEELAGKGKAGAGKAGGGGGMFDLGGFGGGGGGGKSGEPKFYSKYTIWYWFNWPFLIIPLGLVGAEEMLAMMGGGKKKKRRYDDEDDDDDDRPRKKSRARDDDDDDEDDRPRKKSRARDEDEDEDDDRIKKRRR